ncbi:hypothetical protein Tco_0143996 [Tanacetum coccineum]
MHTIPQTDGQKAREPFKLLEDILACLCNRLWQRVGLTILPLSSSQDNNSYHASIRPHTLEHFMAKKSFVSPVCWTKVGKAQILVPELIQETKLKNLHIKPRCKPLVIDRRVYADLNRTPMEFPKSDRVMLKSLALEKGSYVFGKRGKVNPSLCGDFSRSNLKKCHADEPLAVPLDGLNLDDKLYFFEEPLEIVGREVKRFLSEVVSRIINGSMETPKRGPESRGNVRPIQERNTHSSHQDTLSSSLHREP